jgi:hypothetical protein
MKTIGLLIFLGYFSPPASPFELSPHEEITQQLLGQSFTIGKLKMSITQTALDQVITANTDSDWYGFWISRYHFDDELFSESSQKVLDDLQEAENALVQNEPDGLKARQAFGRALHTVQDFYAHSTWADHHTGNNDIHPDLGRDVLANPVIANFCDATGGTLLPKVKDITSGYYDLVTCAPPPPGKCHHGFRGKLYKPFCPFQAGISKDDTYVTLYTRARNQAIQVGCHFNICFNIYFDFTLSLVCMFPKLGIEGSSARLHNKT